MHTYYNEHDKFAAAWLRELMKAGMIAEGEVDERNIQDVRAGELRGFTQCHFFAGIGVWSYALRQAGWPEDEQVWTGSCPCQPFSVSGKRAGASDERHLWPVWFSLIEKSHPLKIFGEQVASDDGLAWLDLVSSDLEGQDYTIGAVDTPACGYGAPHRRQRLYWMADSSGRRCEQRNESERAIQLTHENGDVGQSSEPRLERHSGHERDRHESGRLRENASRSTSAAGILNGFWQDAEWLWCRDQKYRPVESGTFPLAHGAPCRVGRLRGYGNALVAEQAIAFIKACREERLES